MSHDWQLVHPASGEAIRFNFGTGTSLSLFFGPAYWAQMGLWEAIGLWSAGLGAVYWLLAYTVKEPSNFAIAFWMLFAFVHFGVALAVPGIRKASLIRRGWRLLDEQPANAPQSQPE